MAPKGGTRRAVRTSCTTTKPRKKKARCHDESRPSDAVTVSADQGPCKKDDSMEDAGDFSNGGCSTPKAERYKIPAIGTCPPAPKKRRPRCWSLGGRRPISYFASPDIEAFFLHALGGISV